MKKIISALLIAAMILSMSSCISIEENEADSEKKSSVTEVDDKDTEKPNEAEVTEPKGDENDTNDAQNEAENEEVTENTETDEPVAGEESVKATFESCRFTDEVHGIDGEYIGSHIPSVHGMVLVDAVYYISENTRELTKDDFSGFFIYEDKRYELDFSIETANGIGIDTFANYPANRIGRVHLATRVPEAAMNENIEVSLTAMGESVTVTVDPMDTSKPLSRKKAVKAGDLITTESGISLKIRSCEIAEYYYASDVANSKEYKLMGGGNAIHIMMDITNNSDNSIMNVTSYSVDSDGNIQAGLCQIETNNNTELSYIDYDGILPGETNVLHLVAKADGTDNIIRFNIDGVCYYCKG